MLWNFLSPKKLTYFLKRQAVPQAVMKTTQVKKNNSMHRRESLLALDDAEWSIDNIRLLYNKFAAYFQYSQEQFTFYLNDVIPLISKFSVSAVIYMFHLKYLHVFYMKLQKHVKGENLVIYSLQSLSDDLHVEYMLFKKIRASTGFEPVTSAILVSRNSVEALIYSGFFLIA